MSISLRQAAEQGIERVRDIYWGNPLDHFRLAIADGKLPGQTVSLYAPINVRMGGSDPLEMDLEALGLDNALYVPYTGPSEDSPEYQAALAAEQAIAATNRAGRAKGA